MITCVGSNHFFFPKKSNYPPKLTLRRIESEASNTPQSLKPTLQTQLDCVGANLKSKDLHQKKPLTWPKLCARKTQQKHINFFYFFLIN